VNKIQISDEKLLQFIQKTKDEEADKFGADYDEEGEV
tara:strand:+ start:455 stop:565 length:111 start_codon:yes stop_codon:yes gene_type:complete